MHGEAAVAPYTWFVTSKSDQHKQTGNSWQVPSARDNSHLFFLLIEGAIRVESSVDLAHNGQASRPHHHYQRLQYGLIWVDVTSRGASHPFSRGFTLLFVSMQTSVGDLKEIWSFLPVWRCAENTQTVTYCATRQSIEKTPSDPGHWRDAWCCVKIKST